MGGQPSPDGITPGAAWGNGVVRSDGPGSVTGSGRAGSGGYGGSSPRETTVPVTIQHLLVRYAKRGKMRFASHLDVARAFERGVRRAGLPIAYSTGFTPHPKISYAGGAPTGVASEAEYLSLTLTSRAEADTVRERLNAALPDGIDVIAVTEDSGGLPASRLTASEWQVALPGLPADNVVPVVKKFLALAEAPVERLTSKGMRRMDARAAIFSLDVLDDASAGSHLPGGGSPGCALRMVVRHTVPSVRPDDVLNALRDVSDVFPAEQPLMTRLAQGSLGESGVVQL
jgi:radical SAM-linked protein